MARDGSPDDAEGSPSEPQRAGEDTPRVVGRAIEDIQLPRGAVISAIVRGDEVLMAHHDTVIEADDHVILFMADRRQIDEVERLFEVGVSFV